MRSQDPVAQTAEKMEESPSGRAAEVCVARSGSVGEDFDPEAAGARAVEFAEENSLPTAELELASADEDCGGGAYERGIDVGIGVAFGVAVAADFFLCPSARKVSMRWGPRGNEARERGLDIGGDGGIVIFVDEHAGRGVRDVDIADAGLHAGVLNQFGDAGGDVEQLGAAFGAHGDFAGGGGAGFACAGRHG